MRHDIDELFAHLAKSKFRSRFSLKGKEWNYLQQKGLHTILKHAEDFIQKRIAPAHIPNDGKQTPFHNHPVFIAQHATATCCRKCIRKWHKIPENRDLTKEEINYIVEIIGVWLTKEMYNHQ